MVITPFSTVVVHGIMVAKENLLMEDLKAELKEIEQRIQELMVRL